VVDVALLEPELPDAGEVESPQLDGVVRGHREVLLIKKQLLTTTFFVGIWAETIATNSPVGLLTVEI
jgi:hypothetical protein